MRVNIPQLVKKIIIIGCCVILKTAKHGLRLIIKYLSFTAVDHASGNWSITLFEVFN